LAGKTEGISCRGNFAQRTEEVTAEDCRERQERVSHGGTEFTEEESVFAGERRVFPVLIERIPPR
jgi:hypothetical protein